MVVQKEPERDLDVPGVRVIQPVYDLVAVTVISQNYGIFNKSSCNGDSVAQELHKMAKKIVVQMKYCSFSEKDRMLEIDFLQKIKSDAKHGEPARALQCFFSSSY